MNLWHAKPVPQHLRDEAHFLVGQISQPPHQTGYADGLDLLEMKCPRLQELFGQREFPSVFAKCRRMRDYRDHCQFVIRWVVGEKQAGPDFAGNAHVGLPDFSLPGFIHAWSRWPPFHQEERSPRGLHGRRPRHHRRRAQGSGLEETTRDAPDV